MTRMMLDFCRRRRTHIVTLFLILCWSSLVIADTKSQVCEADGTCSEVKEPEEYGADGEEIDGEKEEVEEKEDVPFVCEDFHEKCDFWVRYNECETNPIYMFEKCPKACKMCTGKVDLNMGTPQMVDSKRQKECREKIVEARDYINAVKEDNKLKVVAEGCKLQHESCAFWAVLGECEKNPNYMKTNCAPVCGTCEMLSVETRCPLDPNAPNAWEPGSLNALFEELVTLDEYEPKIYSRPSYAEGDTEETADYIIGPWIITLENVLSQAEAEKLIELGYEEGFERSADVGKKKFDGTFEQNINDRRTSTNAWCQHSCYKDETAQTVVHRIANLTHVPEENSEFLQLLKYEVGQKYETHHDYIHHQRDRQQGVRLMTVFLYLNEVEAGGGTNFPNYNITVIPRRGRALLWPSVLDQAPDDQDGRTMHQALPVEKGIKYGANAWLHQRDFKTPNRNHCQ